MTCRFCGQDGTHPDLDAFRAGYGLNETGLLLASQQAAQCGAKVKANAQQDKLRDQIANSGDC